MNKKKNKNIVNKIKEFYKPSLGKIVLSVIFVLSLVYSHFLHIECFSPECSGSLLFYVSSGYLFLLTAIIQLPQLEIFLNPFPNFIKIVVAIVIQIFYLYTLAILIQKFIINIGVLVKNAFNR